MIDNNVTPTQIPHESIKSPLISRKSTFMSIENEIRPRIPHKSSSSYSIIENFKSIVDPLLKKSNNYKAYLILIKMFANNNEELNFQKKFQILRRINIATYRIELKFFSKKEQNKYIKKVSDIFEKSFFYLGEQYKYIQYYISECGNPDLKLVQELKKTILPLSREERFLLFYQKSDQIEEKIFEINFYFYFVQFFKYFIKHMILLCLFEKIFDSAIFLYNENSIILRNILGQQLKAVILLKKDDKKIQKKVKKTISLFALNLLMFGLSNEGLGNYARLLECLRFGYWLTLNYLGKDNELNIQLLKFKEEAEKNYSNILNSLGEIEKILGKVFFCNFDNSEENEELGKNPESARNTIINEVNEKLYKKYKYKEFNDTNFIITKSQTPIQKNIILNSPILPVKNNNSKLFHSIHSFENSTKLHKSSRKSIINTENNLLSPDSNSDKKNNFSSSILTTDKYFKSIPNRKTTITETATEKTSKKKFLNNEIIFLDDYFKTKINTEINKKNQNIEKKYLDGFFYEILKDNEFDKNEFEFAKSMLKLKRKNINGKKNNFSIKILNNGVNTLKQNLNSFRLKENAKNSIIKETKEKIKLNSKKLVNFYDKLSVFNLEKTENFQKIDLKNEEDAKKSAKYQISSLMDNIEQELVSNNIKVENIISKNSQKRNLFSNPRKRILSDYGELAHSTKGWAYRDLPLNFTSLDQIVRIKRVASEIHRRTLTMKN